MAAVAEGHRRLTVVAVSTWLLRKS